MADNSSGPRHSRRSRPAASSRNRPRDISRLAPSAASDPVVRQTDRLRARSSKDVSPAARARRRRRLTITIATLIGILLVGGAIAAYAYVRVIGNKINGAYNSDFATQQALAPGQQTASAPGDPFYMVLMGSDQRGTVIERSDSLMVARVDPKNKKISIISIPRDSRVAIPGKWTTKINAASALGGVALTIQTVKQLTGLPITHYINLNFKGFADVVDAIGGVWVDVPIEIYDTQASGFGKAYATVHKGYQKLDGKHALTFVRTRHTMADSDYGRMRNQQLFIKALASQALSLSNVFKASGIIDAVASNLDTDLTPAQLADLVLQFKGMKTGGVDSATAPSAPKYISGVSYVILNMPAFDVMIGRMRQGFSLVPKTATGGSTTPTATIKPADVKLTVRNGAGVSGLGKQATDFFTSKGFTVGTATNMNQYVYGRTLIVYQKGHEAQANFVRETLGFGDVLPSAGMYTFPTDVMLVIGKDWKNPVTGSVK
ncbi:MAG TPA: LCP family protein [Coriobacteriia bacterium]